MVFVYLRKIQSLDFLHRLPTTNWHEIPYVNAVLIKFWHYAGVGDFRNLRKLFSVVSKIPYVKIQIFHDRSFTWFLNYFLAKFLEILTTGSLHIGKFLQRQSVSIFRPVNDFTHLPFFPIWNGCGPSIMRVNHACIHWYTKFTHLSMSK